jgi:hypothetical protein
MTSRLTSKATVSKSNVKAVVEITSTIPFKLKTASLFAVHVRNGYEIAGEIHTVVGYKSR